MIASDIIISIFIMLPLNECWYVDSLKINDAPFITLLESNKIYSVCRRPASKVDSRDKFMPRLLKFVSFFKEKK